jgi:hypothetical protein
MDESEFEGPDYLKFEMFLDLYFKQIDQAYDDLYNTIEPHYYEMQW